MKNPIETIDLDVMTGNIDNILEKLSQIRYMAAVKGYTDLSVCLEVIDNIPKFYLYGKQHTNPFKKKVST